MAQDTGEVVAPPYLDRQVVEQVAQGFADRGHRLVFQHSGCTALRTGTRILLDCAVSAMKATTRACVSSNQRAALFLGSRAAVADAFQYLVPGAIAPAMADDGQTAEAFTNDRFEVGRCCGCGHASEVSAVGAEAAA